MKTKFELGKIVITKGVANVIEDDFIAYCDVVDSVQRHELCDWGDLCEEDKQYNDDAVKNGERVLSCYYIGEENTKIWIITEWDRSVTTILLPEEY